VIVSVVRAETNRVHTPSEYRVAGHLRLFVFTRSFGPLWFWELGPQRGS
jgi:hypothetical protein